MFNYTKFFKLMLGPLLAQLITFLSLPIISRYYDPEAFGEYSIVLAILTIFIAFSTLRFDFLFFKENNENTIAFSLFSLTCLTVFSLIFSALYGFLSEDLANMISFYNFFILLFSSSLYYHSNQVFIRCNFLNNFMLNRIFQSLFFILIAISFAYFGVKLTLVDALELSFILPLFIMFFVFYKIDIKTLNYRAVKLSLFIRNLSQAVYSTLSHTLSVSIPLLPIFFLKKYFSLVDVGLFFFVHRY